MVRVEEYVNRLEDGCGQARVRSQAWGCRRIRPGKVAASDWGIGNKFQANSDGSSVVDNGTTVFSDENGDGDDENDSDEPAHAQRSF